MGVLIIMNFQLFISVLAIFIIIYLFHYRDIFNPAAIVSAVFIVCSYIAIYSSERLQLDLSFKAYSLLVLGILSFCVGNIFVNISYKLRHKSFNRFLETNIEYIKMYNKKIILFVSSAFFVIAFISQIGLALSISGGNLSSLIYAYRMEMLSGSERIPSIVSNMETINYAVGYYALYILINNYFVEKIFDHSLILLVLYPCAIGILSGSRGEIIHYFVFSLTIYYYYYLIKKKKKHIDGKLILKMALIFAGMFLFFYLIKFTIGRQDQLGIVEYISGHLASPLKLFDLFVNEKYKSTYWGEETFTRILATFMRGSGVDLRYNTYATFRYLNGVSLGNVYTAFRAYYADFGLIGILIVPFCISMVASILYSNFRTCVLNQKSIVNKNLFLYAYVSYGLFVMFYSNQILEYIINISFIKMVIIWLFFDYIFISGKIRIKIGN